MTLAERQQAALKTYRTNSSPVRTGEALADLRTDGVTPHYQYIADEDRKDWVVQEIFTLGFLSHSNIDAAVVMLDAGAFDEAVMRDNAMRDLTLVEMHEAFVAGFTGDYGDYFGITARSLVGFLRGYLRSEKKLESARIIQKRDEQAEAERTARFWRELNQAEKEGRITIPKFGSGKEARRSMTDAERKAHREKIAGQAEEIYGRYGKHE